MVKIKPVNKDYRPNKYALSNSEVWATGELGQGAVLNIARELIESRKKILDAQAREKVLVEALRTCYYALVSYQFGNDSPELAKVVNADTASILAEIEAEKKAIDGK